MKKLFVSAFSQQFFDFQFYADVINILKNFLTFFNYVFCVTCFGKFLSFHYYQVESYSKNKICHVTESDVTNRFIANRS